MPCEFLNFYHGKQSGLSMYLLLFTCVRSTYIFRTIPSNYYIYIKCCRYILCCCMVIFFRTLNFKFHSTFCGILKINLKKKKKAIPFISVDTESYYISIPIILKQFGTYKLNSSRVIIIHPPANVLYKT